MAEPDRTTVEGPPMVCATPVMRPGGHRIGKIVGDIALPRTVPLPTAVLTAVGAVLGGLAALLVAGFSAALGIGIGIGGAAGYALATFSPLRGESMLTWLVLTARSRRRRQKLDGKKVTFGVGAAFATRAPVGPVLLGRSAVRVNPDERDERGVLRPDRERGTA